MAIPMYALYKFDEATWGPGKTSFLTAVPTSLNSFNYEADVEVYWPPKKGVKGPSKKYQVKVLMFHDNVQLLQLIVAQFDKKKINEQDVPAWRIIEDYKVIEEILQGKETRKVRAAKSTGDHEKAEIESNKELKGKTKKSMLNSGLQDRQKKLLDALHRTSSKASTAHVPDSKNPGNQLTSRTVTMSSKQTADDAISPNEKQLDQYSVKIKQLTDDLLKEKKNNEDISKELKQLQGRVSKLCEQNNKLYNDWNVLKSQVGELKVEKESLLDSIYDHESYVESLRRQLSDAEGEAQIMKAENSNLKTSIAIMKGLPQLLHHMDTLIRIPLETPQSSDEDLPTTYISRKRAGSTDIGGSPKRTRSLDSDEDNWDAFHPPDINYVNEMDDVKLEQTEVTEESFADLDVETSTVEGSNPTLDATFVAKCRGKTLTTFTNQLMAGKWSKLYIATHKTTNQPAKTGENLKEQCDEEAMLQIIELVLTRFADDPTVNAQAVKDAMRNKFANDWGQFKKTLQGLKWIEHKRKLNEKNI